MKNSELSRVMKINDHLWAVDEIGKTTMYVYEGNDRVLLLDTGFGLLDLKELVASLCPGKEIVVVNSHAHGDHNSGNSQFDTVGVGRMDEPNSHHAMDEETRTRFGRNFFDDNPLADKVSLDDWHPGFAKHVVPLQDGDVINLGGIKLEVLETPGHTIGSICLFDRANGRLFTGDLMLTWQVWGQLADSSTLKDYGATLDRLAALQPLVKEVFPAHGRDDNPFGWPIWHLPPETLGIYSEGTRRILDSKAVGSDFTCFAHDGLCVLFDIGGMVYDPTRLGTDKL